MNIPVMQRIDHYLGPMGCLFLVLIKYICFGRKIKTPPKHPSKILLIKFWGIGSIRLMKPALEELKVLYPNCRIDFLTSVYQKEFILLLPEIDRVYSLNLKNLFIFFKESIKIITTIRKECYDIVFDFEFFTNFSAIVSGLIKSYVIGFEYIRFWRNLLYDKMAVYDHSKHISVIFCKLARTLIGTYSAETPSLRPLCVSTQAQLKIQNLIVPLQIKVSDIVVVFNVNASYLSKARRWPIENYSKLINEMTFLRHCKMIFIGGKSEKNYTVGLYNKIVCKENILNLTGCLTIEELIALFDLCDIFIGNDSGPLHLAIGQGAKSISFFGPETPSLYGPIGKGHRIFYSNQICSPCLNIYVSKRNSCSNNQCMKSIESHEVIDSVYSLIAILTKKKQKYEKKFHIIAN